MSDVRRIGIKVPPTESEREALEVALDVLCTGARRVEAELTEPDDDWFPVWLVLTNRQGTIISGDVHKHVMTRAVASFARRVGAVCVGQLASSWMVVASDGVGTERMREVQRQMEAQDGSSEGIPERREAIMLALYTAGAWQMHAADIHRSEGAPPTLGPFESLGSSDDFGAKGGMEGAMADPIKAAVWRRG